MATCLSRLPIPEWKMTGAHGHSWDDEPYRENVVQLHGKGRDKSWPGDSWSACWCCHARG